MDEAERCSQELSRTADKFRRNFKPIESLELMKSSKDFTEAFSSSIVPDMSKSLEQVSASLELMTASKAFTEPLSSSIIPDMSKSLEQVSASLELMTASKAFTEPLSSSIVPDMSKSLKEATASLELMTASKAFSESLAGVITPNISKCLEGALSKEASQPLSQMLGEKFSQSLAPLVDSQSRLSEMMAQSFCVPDLGFAMSQSNALVASAIKDIHAIYSAPNIRIQGIENVIYPGIVGDIRGINASYRSLLTETAETAAARDNVTELQQTWSRMLPPSSAVSSYTHSLRSKVAIDQDTEIEILPPMPQQEDSQGTLYLLLADVSPELLVKWQGSWQALEGSNPDRLSQAASSYKELIRMLLDELAPDVEIDRSVKGSKRKLQVRQVLRGAEGDFAYVMVEGLTKLYDYLCKPAHTVYRNETVVRWALKTGDHLLMLLLSSRAGFDA